MKKVSRFEELLVRGKLMSRVEVEAEVSRLMLDDGFAGVLGLLEGLKGEFVGASSAQEVAVSPGKQCHGLGSVFGLDCALNELRSMEPRVGGRKKESSGMGAERPEEVVS